MKKLLIISLLAFCLGAEELCKEIDMAAVASRNLFDLDSIYQGNYQFSVPRPMVEQWLTGVAFDNKVPYTREEQELIQRDTQRIFDRMRPDLEKIALITAGAPGAGKTRLLEKLLGEGSSNYGYVDPDAVWLKGAELTFQSDVRDDSSGEARRNAYTKWRPASNGATQIMAAHLIREGKALAFGMTATSPATAFFFKFLKDQGYTLSLVHVTAPDDVRWGSIQKRDERFIQTTEVDTREKGRLLPQRIADTYLKFADEIAFYYRGQVDEAPVLSAIWKRGVPLTIIAPDSYARIKAIHNEAVEVLGKGELRWEATVEASPL